LGSKKGYNTKQDNIETLEWPILRDKGITPNEMAEKFGIPVVT
jgi:hypothetical protein